LKGLLLECIHDSNVESVLLINRQSVDIKHPKVKEILIFIPLLGGARGGSLMENNEN